MKTAFAGSGDFTQSDVQSAFEQAFASAFGPNDAAAPLSIGSSANVGNDAQYGASSSAGSSDNFGNDLSFGTNSSFGSSDNFGNNIVFGSGSSFGSSDNFGNDVVFGDNVSFGSNVNFGQGDVFGANDSFGSNINFGSNNLIGSGATWGSSVNLGSGDVQGANDDTPWSLFLQSAGNVSQMSTAQLDAAATSFLNGLGQPAGGVAGFVNAFNNGLVSNANISQIDAAIDSVSGAASTFGAVQNRLQHTMANLTTTSENLTAANSRITDVDMASAMTAFTSQQVLQQAGTAMLAGRRSCPTRCCRCCKGCSRNGVGARAGGAARAGTPPPGVFRTRDAYGALASTPRGQRRPGARGVPD